MTKYKKLKNWAAFTVLILLPALGIFYLAKAQWIHTELPYYSPEDVNAKKDKVQPLSNIVLYNQHGKKVTLDDFDSCILLVNIFFASCPQVCPEMNKQIQSIAEMYVENPEVKFLTISIDPENDTTAALLNVANAFKADMYKRQFCRGSKSEIYDWVLNELFLATEQRGADFIHDDKVAIVDKNRYLRVVKPTRGKTNSERLTNIKAISDDIDNLIYEYRKKVFYKR